MEKMTKHAFLVTTLGLGIVQYTLCGPLSKSKFGGWTKWFHVWSVSAGIQNQPVMGTFARFLFLRTCAKRVTFGKARFVGMRRNLVRH